MSESDIVEMLRHCPRDWHPSVVAEKAADTITALRPEVERLTGELSIWKSVFPDIAPERILPDRSKLEAEHSKFKEILQRSIMYLQQTPLIDDVIKALNSTIVSSPTPQADESENMPQ